MTDPLRFLAYVSELTDAQCIASDGGHRVMCGVLSSTVSYFAMWLGMSLTSDAMRRLFRPGLLDYTDKTSRVKLTASKILENKTISEAYIKFSSLPFGPTLFTISK